MGIKAIFDPVARSHFRNKYLDADAYDEGYYNGVTAGKAQGKQEEYDRFWDAYQENGYRADYSYAFSRRGWNDVSFKPKYGVVGTTYDHMFWSSFISRIEAPLDFTRCTNINYIFAACGNLLETEVDLINILSGDVSALFPYCTSLKTATVRNVSESVALVQCFDNTPNLENLTIDGVIGQNGFDVHWSTRLTHDSLMSIINALQDKSGVSGTWTVTLGGENLAKLSEAEIGIAEAKGWVLA